MVVNAGTIALIPFVPIWLLVRFSFCRTVLFRRSCAIESPLELPNCVLLRSKCIRQLTEDWIGSISSFRPMEVIALWARFKYSKVSCWTFKMDAMYRVDFDVKELCGNSKADRCIDRWYSISNRSNSGRSSSWMLLHKLILGFRSYYVHYYCYFVRNQKYQLHWSPWRNDDDDACYCCGCGWLERCFLITRVSWTYIC